MKHRSQRRNLFLSFTVVIIAFTIAYLLLIFGRDYQNSKERYLNDRAQLVGQVASQAENYFSLMDNILLQIIYSDAIYEALTAANHDLSPTNYFDINLQAKKNCTQDMSAYISITNQISRASIFGVRGDYCSIGSPRRNLNTSDILELDAVKKAELLNGSLCIQGPSADPLSSSSDKLYYSASRLSKRGYVSYGYTEVLQSYENLEKICQPAPTVDIFIFDGSEQLLYPAPSYVTVSEEVLRSRYQEARAHLDSGDTSQFEYEGEIISSIKLNNGFILLAVENRMDLFEYLYHIRNTTFFFAFLVSLFSIWIVYYISKYTSQSVEKLTAAVKKIDFHDYILPLNPDDCTTHETRQLAQATGQMLQKLQQYAVLSSESQMRELQATIVALQSQLNPHFINNTLAAISSAALSSGDFNIVNMCSHLSRILIYTQEVDTATTLKMEFEYTEHYLALMKYRYGDRLEYTLKFDHVLEEIPVPRLILQPLVENCIYHGFNSDRALKKIDISGEADGNTWKIYITDNGRGFSEESKAAIHDGQERIKRLLDSGQASYIRSDELGVLNTFSRLYIRQKQNTVFEIHSTHSGATVTIGGLIYD